MIFKTIDQRTSKKRFQRFLSEHNYAAWHKINADTIQDENSPNFNVVNIHWYSDTFVNHTDKCPDIGEYMVLIKEIPDTKNTRIFDVYCYAVIDKFYSSFGPLTTKIKYIETKKCAFDVTKNEYGFFKNENLSSDSWNLTFWDIFKPWKWLIKNE